MDNNVLENNQNDNDIKNNNNKDTGLVDAPSPSAPISPGNVRNGLLVSIQLQSNSMAR